MTKPPRVPLREVVTETQYGTPQKANSNGQGRVVLRMNNIMYDGGWELEDLKHVDLREQEVLKYTVHPGDLLFNRTNSPELVGKTAVWQGHPSTKMRVMPEWMRLLIEMSIRRYFPPMGTAGLVRSLVNG